MVMLDKGPGVYVEELSSGVRTISGVATSITAFLGRAQRGPVGEPVMVNSFTEFERTFGGLWLESHLGYSVRDFFAMGGGKAIIVRIHHPKSTNDDGRAKLTFGSDKEQLVLSAASAGLWGSKLVATRDRKVPKPSDNPTRFNLTVTGAGRTETFLNVSRAPNEPRCVKQVLENESKLVRVSGALPTNASGLNDVEKATVTGGNDGEKITNDDVTAGLSTLDRVDLFNMLVIPPYLGDGDVGLREVDGTVLTTAIKLATKRRAVVIMDSPQGWTDTDTVTAKLTTDTPFVDRSDNAVTYFPRICQPDPLRDGAIGTFAPSGAIAGIIAATDAQRGVWKSPAGVDAKLAGVSGLSVTLTDDNIGTLNSSGVNCLRRSPGTGGHVVWGARTINGADAIGSEWKYLAVRRTSLFLQESLRRGLQWVVFEPNDEPLWSQIRLNVGSFMNTLFRQGAFKGSSPREAYQVKCDSDTTTQDRKSVV